MGVHNGIEREARRVTAVRVLVVMIALSACGCSSTPSTGRGGRPAPDGMRVDNDVISINGRTSQNITIRSSGGEVSIGMPGDVGTVSYCGSREAIARLAVEQEGTQIRLVILGSHNRVAIAERIRSRLSVDDRGQANEITYR